MNFDKISEYSTRLKRIKNLNKILKDLYKENNAQAFVKQRILNEENLGRAERLLSKIEEHDRKIEQEKIDEAKKQEILRVTSKRNNLLSQTDWTQLPDADLTVEQRKEYREYRQYLRDIPELFKNKQILKFDTMNFEEWKEDKPIYRIKRKSEK